MSSMGGAALNIIIDIQKGRNSGVKLSLNKLIIIILCSGLSAFTFRVLWTGTLWLVTLGLVISLVCLFQYIVSSWKINFLEFYRVTFDLIFLPKMFIFQIPWCQPKPHLEALFFLHFQWCGTITTNANKGVRGILWMLNFLSKSVSFLVKLSFFFIKLYPPLMHGVSNLTPNGINMFLGQIGARRLLSSEWWKSIWGEKRTCTPNIYYSKKIN